MKELNFTVTRTVSEVELKFEYPNTSVSLVLNYENARRLAEMLEDVKKTK